MSVGATSVLMAERLTPQATFRRLMGAAQGQSGKRPTVFFGAPTGFAGMLASAELPHRDAVSLRLVSSAGEALPSELGERCKRHFGVDIVDGIGSTEKRRATPFKAAGQKAATSMFAMTTEATPTAAAATTCSR